MTFKVFLLHVLTGDLYELPYKSFNYVEELNAGSNATFQFDYQTIKDDVASQYGTNVKDLFTAVFSEIWIEIDNGTKIWYGVVSDYYRTKEASGSYTLQVAACDYVAIFQKRRTADAITFTAVDPASIPWSLISTSQALTYGDFGITQGATAATGLSVTVIYNIADIKQSISDLSNFKTQGSFDFDIDYTKKLNIYFPTKGTARLNVVLDDNNILANSVNIPVVLNITNSVYVTGQGINNDRVYVNRVASNAQINQYKRLEDVISDPKVSDTTILNAEGDKYLNLYQVPLYAISIKHDDTVDITTYGLGDTIVVNIPEENISFTNYRVKKRMVDVGMAGELTCQVDLLTI